MKNMVLKAGVICLLFAFAVITGCGATNTSDNSAGAGGAEQPSENTATQKTIELNVNNYLSSTHHFSYNVYEPWKKFVEEKTNGRVVVNIHHGSTLGGNTSAMEDISAGLYDVGYIMSTVAYDTKAFPFTIGNLPFAFSNPEDPSTTLEQANLVLDKFHEKYAGESFKDVKSLGIFSTDFYILHSVSPIRSLDDLQNKKIRVSGQNENDMIKALGGVPVALPTTDIYQGLDKGTIDATIYSISGSTGLKIFETAPYVTNFGFSVNPIISLMNQKFYNNLPEDLQQLFDNELNPKLVELFRQTYMTESDKALAQIAEEIEGKGEIIEINPEETQKMNASAKEIWEKWVDDASKKGYPGEQMMNDFKTILQEHGFQLPY